METAVVVTEGDIQTVRLPRTVHLPARVRVRHEGEAIVLEPLKAATWPAGFFDEIHITDPTFERPAQGQVPPVRPI